ncbi:MAG: hypothetical protein J5806_01720 [Lentisphaeria bacterium]|nr:hypothetical protein [Lentisphaeria bacterium]
MIKKLFWSLAAAAFTLSAAEPSIYFSLDKTTRADYGGTGVKATVSGLQEPSGVKSVLLVRKSKKKYRADDLLRDGISGKAFPVGTQQDGAILTLKYQPEPRIKSAEGSMSFWVRPENWNGGEKKNVRHFVSARQGDNWLIIYKNTDSQDLLAYYGNWKKRAGVTIARCSIRSWKQGEWHHIGVAWNEKALVLYVDGRQKGSAKMKQLLPEDLGILFFGEYWSGDPGQTLLDEVRIFDRYLTEQEMSAEFSRFAEKLSSVGGAPMAIGVSEKDAVKADGIIGADEYSAMVGGMRDFQKKNVFASSQSVCRFAWDKEKLYVAVSSPERKRIAKLTGRDSAVYTDDSVELYLKTGSGLYQFVVNPAGTLLDSKNGDLSWNAGGFESRSSFADGMWHLEAAVPWKDIGLTAEAGTRIRLNLARNYADSKENTQLAPCRRGIGYGETAAFAELVCLEKGISFDVSELGDLPHGKLDANLKIASAKKENYHLRLTVDSSMFPVDIERSLTAEPGKNQSFRIKRNLPDRNTLSFQLGIPELQIILYRANLDYSEPEAMRKWYIYTDLKKAELVFVMRAAALNNGKTQMKLDFVTPDGKTSRSMTVSLSDKEPTVEARFPLKGLNAGRYFLDYSLTDASGKKYYSDREEYEYFKDGAYWDNFAGGSEETVPSPWTAVSVKGNLFSCWGREIVFGGDGLVTSILSRNKELLSRPVGLKLDGKPVAFKAEKVSAAPARAVFRLKPQDPAVPLTVEVTAEFDGFCYFTGTIAPGSEIRSLTLEIPMDRKYADAFDDCASPHYKTSLRKNTSFELNAYTLPFFWCGGDEVGLMGGTATRSGWHVKNKTRSMHVAADGREVLLSLPVVDTPLKTGAAERKFSFYLNPTPVKPRRTAFPALRNRVNVMHADISSRFYCYLHPGYFTPFWKWVLARVRQDKRTEVGRMMFIGYFAPKGASPMSPAWNYYCTEWVNPPPGLGEYSGDQADMKKRESRNRNSFTYACLNCKSFYDHQLQCVYNALHAEKWGQLDLKNLYFDLAWPKPCGNALHGCKRKDDFGDTILDNDLLPLRRFYIRTLRMLQQKSPDGWMIGHVFPSRTPSDNFFDYIVAGEMYDSRVFRKVNYYDVLTPDLMRIAYGSRTNEAGVALIPQFLRSLQCYAPDRVRSWDPLKKEFDRPIRHFLAYSVCFGLENHYDLWTAGEKLPEKGKGHVDIWHRFFEKLGPERTFRRLENLVPGTDRVFGCIYAGNGSKMLVVLNDTDAEKELTVPAPWSDISSMKDIFSGKIYPVQDKTVRLKLAPRDSAFLYQGKM